MITAAACASRRPPLMDGAAGTHTRVGCGTQAVGPAPRCCCAAAPLRRPVVGPACVLLLTVCQPRGPATLHAHTCEPPRLHHVFSLAAPPCAASAPARRAAAPAVLCQSHARAHMRARVLPLCHNTVGPLMMMRPQRACLSGIQAVYKTPPVYSHTPSGHRLEEAPATPCRAPQLVNRTACYPTHPHCLALLPPAARC